MRLMLPLTLLTSVSSLACSAEDDTPVMSAGNGIQPAASPATGECDRGTLESDITELTAFEGPGVDSATGQLRPLSAGQSIVISSTYLTLRPEPMAERIFFDQLMAPLLEQLPTQPGLLATQFMASQSCGTARTLSVWASEEEMYGFVTSENHMAAVRRVGEVSRGQSVVTHWSSSDVGSASWTEAERRLQAFDGPVY